MVILFASPNLKQGCVPVQDLIHVAIVDNDLSALEEVSEAFKRYGETHDVTFSIEFFRDPLTLPIIMCRALTSSCLTYACRSSTVWS